MITSKQRANLKTLAMKLTPVVTVGKDGINDSVIASIEASLKARELIKIKLLPSAKLDKDEAMEKICTACICEPVLKIGSILIVYKRSDKKDFKHIQID